MYDLSISSSRCLMFIRHAVDFLYPCPLIKFEANWALNSLKVLTAEPDPCKSLQRGGEGSAHDLAWHLLKVH